MSCDRVPGLKIRHVEGDAHGNVVCGHHKRGAIPQRPEEGAADEQRRIAQFRGSKGSHRTSVLLTPTGEPHRFHVLHRPNR
jgi:hypothetical protein